ncbi:MAG TPA: alanine racemase [Coriobacteriia bacterium]|nr:alanine racemase [Coriobacteriia bacterium]
MAYERWAWIDVDLEAVAHNVRVLKARTAPGTRFMAVVKADGYGHGTEPVARAAIEAGADRLGVATIEEAVELREAAVDAPVHILSEPPPSSVPLVLEHRLIPTVTTRSFAEALGYAARAAGTRALVHLKVDTGMNRVGVRVEDAPEFASTVALMPGLDLEGVFTHFATADVPGDWEYEAQLSRFRDVINRLRDEGVRPELVHAANSPATILHPESHMAMVRCGIAIYGLHPAPSTRDRIDLRPAMSVRARLSLVKRIGMGEGVSYGLTWRAAAPSTIATLPLGYADGVHRVLSNKMEVLIGGVRCAQVGRVCMDQLMVEVPRGVEAREGDEAVLVGTQGPEHIDMDELAETAGTINYEMACAFGMRLPRRYGPPPGRE